MTQDPRRWTIRSMRDWCRAYFERAELDSPILDADLLLAHTLGLRRIDLFMQMDRPLVAEERTAFKALVLRRAQHREPLAYITGRRDFWSLSLEVSPDVLIPRPETERVVELVLEALADQRDHTLNIADVGTGSGALALALASELPGALLWASDSSQSALDVASRNASAHHLDARVHFFHGDLLDPIPSVARPLDLIVSNPPYVALDEAASLAPEVRDHEPTSALFAGALGLDIIDRLVPQAFDALGSEGLFFCEIGAAQGDAVSRCFQRAGFLDVDVITDHAQRDRVVRGRRPPP